MTYTYIVTGDTSYVPSQPVIAKCEKKVQNIRNGKSKVLLVRNNSCQSEICTEKCLYDNFFFSAGHLDYQVIHTCWPKHKFSSQDRQNGTFCNDWAPLAIIIHRHCDRWPKSALCQVSWNMYRNPDLTLLLFIHLAWYNRDNIW